MNAIVVILPLILTVARCVVFKYNGDVPSIPMNYSADGEIQFSAAIKIDARETFVLGKPCGIQSKCTVQPHTNVYDPQKYGGKKVGGTNLIVLDGKALLCHVYETPIFTPAFNATPALFVAIASSGGPASLAQDGVLALNFERFPKYSGSFRRLLELVTNKVIIFRRGAFKQQLSDKRITETKGVFSLGEQKISGCGDFTYRYTDKNAGWSIKADITIGGKLYSGQQISFSVDQPSKFPAAIFEQFKDKDEADLPEAVFEIEGSKFTLNRQNLVQYKAGKMSLDVETNSRPTIVLGRNFLKDFCIALRTNGDLASPEIGLAPIIKLKDDPEWEEL
ncbi:unnamed protein product [Bursaphelenchus xylophilus]|uniref:(pine wood nematode) hypothetical protein n=1 Tax=Bursaphelenchus xylophilus TaxID=6326 RepID=A0A1I7S0J4_BURXY|nr:unnamed protein product [Bursaphelenchus xylophilus]CAG9132286.1 unnamed protein product [Bursaphelenchus xylophilus]